MVTEDHDLFGVVLFLFHFKEEEMSDEDLNVYFWQLINSLQKKDAVNSSKKLGMCV